MAMTAEREALIKQHNRLKAELEDIKIEMDKLEKANEYLRRQNNNMRQMMEVKQAREKPSASSVPAMGKTPEIQRPQPLLSGFSLPKADFIMDTLSQATTIGDAATGELFKQALNIADDFARILQLSDETEIPQHENVFQSLIPEMKDEYENGGSLSCEESCSNSITPNSDASDGVPRWPDQSNVVHMGYVREATASETENLAENSVIPGDA